jgi:pyruvate ferredoxin oxidoreductase beta subunit
MALKLKDVTDEEQLYHGSNSCPGCGAYLGLRLALKTLGKNTIIINPTGCISACCMMGETKVPFFHPLFGNAASIVGGVDSGLRMLGKREGKNLLVYGGDGGTADIGLQALSGAVERGHDFIYICYDNESYMNTGGQRSSTTPFGALTSTTPMGSAAKGESRLPQLRKSMPAIMLAHGTPYVATASIAYPLDYIQKVQTASEIQGPAYIHLYASCPPGWGVEPSHSIKVARLAVETGFFPLYEIVDGEKTFTVKIRKKKNITEYLEIQRRFRYLAKDHKFLKIMKEEVRRNLQPPPSGTKSAG